MTRLLLEGPLYFAASARHVRHQRAGRGRRRYCVLAAMPIVTAAQLRDRVYAVCGARVIGAQHAIRPSGAPEWLPIVSPLCQWCAIGVHPDALAEVQRLIGRLTVFPNGGAHDRCGAGPAYVAACRAQAPRPGTWRIADEPTWERHYARLQHDLMVAETFGAPALPSGDVK